MHSICTGDRYKKSPEKIRHEASSEAEAEEGGCLQKD